MPAHQNIRVPNKGYAAAIAGEHLYRMGPILAHQLFAAVEFGTDKTTKEAALQRAVTSGWLTEQADGRINLSPAARAHYDRVAGLEVVEYVGQIAAVRTPPDIFARPPLSKKYIPNPRGTRQDIPAWSVRAPEFGLKTVGGLK